MSKWFLFLFPLSTLFSGASCNNGPACTAGVPVAIFSDQLPQVLTHLFELNDLESTERITFVNGMEMEILQSGCTGIRQEYRTKVLPKPGEVPDSFWLGMAIAQFNYLGGLGPEYQPYRAWEEAFQQMQEDFKLGQSVEVGPGVHISVDRIPHSDHDLLLIILAQNNE